VIFKVDVNALNCLQVILKHASVVCRCIVLLSSQITWLVIDLDALFKGRLCCFPKDPLGDVETWSESVDKVLGCKGTSLSCLCIYVILYIAIQPNILCDFQPVR